MQPWGSHGHSFCCCCTSNFIIYDTLCTAMTYHFIYLQPHLHSLCMKLQLSIKNEGDSAFERHPPFSVSKDPVSSIFGHFRWVTGPHLHVLNSRVLLFISVSFLGWMVPSPQSRNTRCWVQTSIHENLPMIYHVYMI